MKSTRDRAISILTTDVGSYVRSLDGGYYAGGYADGDLGENLLVDGVDFDYFEVGRVYRFSSSGLNGEDGDTTTTMTGEDVVVEITEPIVPCGNLCRLPYVVGDPR